MSDARIAMVPVRLDWRNKLGRAAWGIVQALLYRPSPRLAHGWRRMLLRLFGARIGAGAHPYPRAKIWAPWNLTMDARACIADDVDCYCVAPIHLEADATVSQYSYLCTASHDTDLATLPLTAAPIRIGRKAWVGADVFVGPGVTIAAGAVVGARSTVFAAVGEGEIVAGSPARHLRARAPEAWR